MMDKKIREAVLKQIKPTDKKLLKTIELSLNKLNELLKKAKLDAVAVVGGSIAKDTYLKGDHDCDVFVKFNPKKYKDKDISKELTKALKTLKPELVHGSRDYFFIKNQIGYEIVPVLNIQNPSEAVNVTDMSPMHVDWVKKHPGFEDEIRLAKQFCKAAKIYGAESYIRGVSGHVLDILVIHYGGFEKLLKASQKWKDKEVIDPEKYYAKSPKGKGGALTELNKSKIESPIIVIDPVLKERNAAAAIGYEKLERFKKAAAEFLKKPSASAFKIKPITKTELKKRAQGYRLVVMEAEPMKGKEDVVGAKLLKALELIRNQMKFYDFDVKEADWEWDKKGKATFWFIVDKRDLFPVVKWPGPPLEEKSRVEGFKKKHKKTFIDKGRIYSYVKRKYTKLDDLLKAVLKDKLLSQKTKKIKIIPVK